MSYLQVYLRKRIFSQQPFRSGWSTAASKAAEEKGDETQSDRFTSYEYIQQCHRFQASRVKIKVIYLHLIYLHTFPVLDIVRYNYTYKSSTPI